eukprot:scaffold110956_cov43-Prasinocladus_malaysianus.AAC.1
MIRRLQACQNDVASKIRAILHLVSSQHASQSRGAGEHQPKPNAPLGPFEAAAAARLSLRTAFQTQRRDDAKHASQGKVDSTAHLPDEVLGLGADFWMVRKLEVHLQDPAGRKGGTPRHRSIHTV